MEETKPLNNKRKKIALIVFIIIAVLGALTLYLYLRYQATHITTDDAFIEGTVHTIAAKVPGTAKKIHVKDNQAVENGDLLFEIDPADYDVIVKEALSGLNAERARISEIEATVEAAKKQLLEFQARVESEKANLELQKVNLAQAEIDINRAENLYNKKAISKERYQKTETDYHVNRARVKAVTEQLKQAEIASETQKAIIKQAETAKISQLSKIKEMEAKFDAAQLQYEYTKIYSPSDGYVTKKSVEIGNQIQAGQPLMAIVSLDDIYVTANYKETQLENIRPGQKVKMKVDTFSEKTFYGTVDSIMAGTGAVFSLFPPENATGNYVKVVQRIPVKILFDKDTDPEHVLRIGMSVVPTVLIDK
jgi:membrane fusion protein (multidrug efflux system)